MLWVNSERRSISERLLLAVDGTKDGDDREGVAARNPIAGTADDRRSDWESFLLRKWNQSLDKRSLKSRRESFEDPDRTLTDSGGADSERRFNSGSRTTSGYGSVVAGGRRAEEVGWETPRGRHGFRVRISEERSGPDEESENSGKEIDQTDDWLKSPRRGLASRNTEAPGSSSSGSRVGRRIRSDDQHETSDRGRNRLGGRSTVER